MCEQGWVVPYRIIATGENIQLCLECEAVWSHDVQTLGCERYSPDGEQGTFWSLVPFLEERGLSYTPGTIEALPLHEG
ncbi:hypothetical protein [Neorhizobium sp. JUb45]|uniref:hypothetical protein n=1 Tax=unclassified Neorhizobium TaxID=2629175 RepID=UPI00104F86F5|nr:hypothetical protein [Neorhizobium sp. JUb45]TCR04251.1 hypothetical protein EDF70_102349 [Neorhizobium sp. JUb45]